MMTSWLDDLFANAGAPVAGQYLTLSTDPTLSAERVLVPAAGQLSGSDGGAGGSYSLGLAAVAGVAGTYTATNYIVIDAYGRVTTITQAYDIELPVGVSNGFGLASSALGAQLSVYAGDATGGTGGALVLRSGTGSVEPGVVSIKCGGTECVRVKHDGSSHSIGFGAVAEGGGVGEILLSVNRADLTASTVLADLCEQLADYGLIEITGSYPP